MPLRQVRARRSAVLFSVLMAIPMATSSVSAEPGDGLRASSDGLQRGEKFQGLETDKFDPQGAELVPVVIKLDVAPVASYRGVFEDWPARSSSWRGVARTARHVSH